MVSSFERSYIVGVYCVEGGMKWNRDLKTFPPSFFTKKRDDVAYSLRLHVKTLIAKNIPFKRGDYPKKAQINKLPLAHFKTTFTGFEGEGGAPG